MTVLEVVTVMLVIIILVVIMLPVFAQIQRRAEKAGCIANLRALHVAADLYMQEHHFWPQIKTNGVDPTTVATKWIAALQPYGIAQVNWECPTIQKSLHNPDMTDPDNARIDYISSPFDMNPQSPYRWATQPWFIESSDNHGGGNLILFPDGHVQELGDFLAQMKKTPAPQPH